MKDGFPSGREEKRQVLLQAVSDVRQTIEEWADASEEGTTLAMPMVKAIEAAGLFKLKLPAELGGAEADPVTQMEVIEALSYIYPSAGWVVMTNATNIGQPAAMLPDETIAEVFAGGRVPLAAGAGAPSGIATPTPGGYRLTGRWQFSSGSPHAEWRGLGVTVPNDDGVPEIRSFFIPASSTRLHDNWRVAGLRGTGSNDVSADDVFVPERYTWIRTSDTLRGLPKRGGPIFLLRGPGFVSNEHAAFALGVARRALDTLIEETQTKRRGRGAAAVTLSDRSVFQRFVGRADLQLRAARSMTMEVHERAWETVCEGNLLSLRQDNELRASAVYCTEVAAEITTQAFRYGGGAALHLNSKLQQCLRDVNAGAQHFAVSDVAYENHGQSKLGGSEANPLY